MRFINEDGGFALSVNLQKKVNSIQIQKEHLKFNSFIILSIREEICGKLWVCMRVFLTGVLARGRISQLFQSFLLRTLQLVSTTSRVR